MLDDAAGDGDTPEQPEGMLMLAINDSYWLAEGDQYLQPMLDGSGFFPKPIICVRFKDSDDLSAFIGPDRSLTDFWGINPDVVDRLRRDEHIREVSGDNL